MHSQAPITTTSPTERPITTPAGRWEFYSGAYPLLYCGDREIGMSSPVDLTGHTITARFTGSKAYNNTHIRLKDISLRRQ
ncbi:MAG TPA: hypothetical protein VJ901_13690 [Thermoanaerobaculia bacterium]|nr:hypothetical protein [Thermoanaerobaculia bacterium]